MLYVRIMQRIFWLGLFLDMTAENADKNYCRAFTSPRRHSVNLCVMPTAMYAVFS